MTWKLADAKNKFSEVVDKALKEGPQKVTRRCEAVIVLALKDFEHLTGSKPGIKEYLMRAPSLKGLNLRRDSSPLRKADL